MFPSNPLSLDPINASNGFSLIGKVDSSYEVKFELVKSHLIPKENEA